MIYLVLALLLGYLLWSLYVRFTHYFGAPFVPMEAEVVRRVLQLAEVKEGDVFYDLGSGDGRLVIAAALRDARANGIELDKMRTFYSRLWIKILGVKNASIINENFFDTDLGSADVVSMFLLQETNQKLKSKLEKELKPGARVVSYAFTFEGWKDAKKDPNLGSIYGPIYLYVIPKKPENK